MELFLPAVISAVIGVLILVAFFGMSKNLRDIRLDIDALMKNKKADDKKALRVQYYVYRSLPGNEHKQAIALTEIIYFDLLDASLSLAERDALYEKLKTKYQPFFEKLGQPFPLNIAA